VKPFARSLRTLATLSALCLPLAVGAPAAEAAPFTFGITVSGDAAGTGTITLPGDAGVSTAGVDLALGVSLLGNPATFTEAEIFGIAWQGADPSTAPDFEMLSLSLFVLDPATGLTLTLNDNGGGVGDATCADPIGGVACLGGPALAGETTWTYALRADGGGGGGGGAPGVPGLPALGGVLCGVGALAAARALRRRVA
jgi:hypothetical protein